MKGVVAVRRSVLGASDKGRCEGYRGAARNFVRNDGTHHRDESANRRQIIIFPRFSNSRQIRPPVYTLAAFAMLTETLQVLILACLTIGVLHMLLLYVAKRSSVHDAAELFAAEVEAEEAARARVPARRRQKRRTLRRRRPKRVRFSDAEEEETPSTSAPDFAHMEDELKAWMRRETSSWASGANKAAPARDSSAAVPTAADATAAAPAAAGVANTSADGQSATSIDALFAQQQQSLERTQAKQAHATKTATQDTDDVPSDLMQLQVATVPRSTATASATRASVKAKRASSAFAGTGIPDAQCDGTGYTNPMNADDLGGGLKAFDTAMGSFAAF